ncbi:hypothetical protein D041_0459B, partial [Vibrio parahaemolyticus EKP-008]
LLKQY